MPIGGGMAKAHKTRKVVMQTHKFSISQADAKKMQRHIRNSGIGISILYSYLYILIIGAVETVDNFCFQRFWQVRLLGQKEVRKW